MRAIIVDDEPLMIKSFIRNSDGINDIEIVGRFEDAEKALEYAKGNRFELAVLDIKMPKMSGIELAVKLREIYPKLLIVFISAYDEYLRDYNAIGGDDYIIKPYTQETVRRMVEKMLLVEKRLKKRIYIQMFGRFNVLIDGKPVNLCGKTKEILAYIACRRGLEVSNEMIYTAVWEGREYSNDQMKTYYNAVKRLKTALAGAGAEDLLISTAHGYMLNTEICDCDYFDWLDKNPEPGHRFEGAFLSEYSWGEGMLSELLNTDYYE